VGRIATSLRWTWATSRPSGSRQDQPVAHAQHLAVDVQDGPAMLVSDVGILAQPEEALAD
jgi:hypothetical protein